MSVIQDHREIGKLLNLFMFSEFSPGCAIWLPNGNLVYSLLSEKIREFNLENGYVEVRTPTIYKSELFKTSGHWQHYKQNMYQIQGEDEYALKPMNCPIHMEIFRSRQWSYRELPYRIHDQGSLHRNEVSGAIGGLTRCRAFCQDDAHCFVTPETLEQEIISLIEMTKAVYKAFDMPIRAVLSTRPSDFMGDIADWDRAEAVLQDVLRNSNLNFEINQGDGAFYGPKIDFVVKDSQQREWQTATIQLDFQLPKNFGLEYTGPNNEKFTPIVVHRAMYGSFERFIAILLEHYQGLPFWLSPTQIVAMPIGQDQVEYAKAVKMAFELGMGRFRTELDDSNRTLPQKIAMAQERKIPYMLVVGKREVENNVVSVRTLDGKQSIKSVHELTGELYDKGQFHFGMFKKNVH